MNTLWTPMVTTDNFRNWLNSGGGWMFLSLLLLVILSISLNLAVYVRRAKSRILRGGQVKSGLGRMLAIAGGFIILVGAVLPPFPVVGYYGSNAPTYLLGILWLVWFTIPRRASAIWGLLWGIIVLLNTLLYPSNLAVYGDKTGVYAVISGSLVLVVGSVLAYVQARNGEAREPKDREPKDGEPEDERPDYVTKSQRPFDEHLWRR